MLISLVLATVNRTEEVKRFLEHLDRSQYSNYELIVVDQNPDSRLIPILDTWKGKFPIVHLKSEKGLSRARNVGLRCVKGDIVSFPDDDCWYPPDTLKQVIEFFKQYPNIDGLSGRVVDEKGKGHGGRWKSRSGFIDRFNIWQSQRESAVFLKRRVIDVIGDFDETLGVGAGTPWGSGEGTDYLLRVLEAGFKLFYEPRIVIYHPQEKPVNELSKVLSYSRGMGYVLRKHDYPFWYLVYWELRALAGLLLSLAKGDTISALIYLRAFKGRIQGWRSGKQQRDLVTQLLQ